jgi:hypothetical protein
MSRFRPVMLTAVSTVLGLIPIAPTIFWGPMAFAIMGGLLVATVLTLIFLPALYVAWFRVKESRSQDGVLASAPWWITAVDHKAFGKMRTGPAPGLRHPLPFTSVKRPVPNDITWGTDTPKLCATSCGGVPLASSFLAA